MRSISLADRPRLRLALLAAAAAGLAASACSSEEPARPARPAAQPAAVTPPTPPPAAEPAAPPSAPAVPDAAAAPAAAASPDAGTAVAADEPELAAPTAIEGRFTRVSGRVQLRRVGLDHDYEPAETAMAVYGGDRVRCGDDGSAELVLFDGSRMVLSPNSNVTVLETGAATHGRPSLIVWLGRVMNEVAKVAGGSSSRYEVHTATAVAGVRGTRFSVDVAEDGATRVAVLEGTVEVETDDPAAGELPAVAGPDGMPEPSRVASLTLTADQETTLVPAGEAPAVKKLDRAFGDGTAWRKARRAAALRGGETALAHADLVARRRGQLARLLGDVDTLGTRREALAARLTTAAGAADLTTQAQLREVEQELARKARAAGALARRIDANRQIVRELREEAVKSGAAEKTAFGKAAVAADGRVSMLRDDLVRLKHRAAGAVRRAPSASGAPRVVPPAGATGVDLPGGAVFRNGQVPRIPAGSRGYFEDAADGGQPTPPPGIDGGSHGRAAPSGKADPRKGIFVPGLQRKLPLELGPGKPKAGGRSLKDFRGKKPQPEEPAPR